MAQTSTGKEATTLGIINSGQSTVNVSVLLYLYRHDISSLITVKHTTPQHLGGKGAAKGNNTVLKWCHDGVKVAFHK